MINYDFLNLSPYEFESLSRDLLQKHLNCHLESFSSGADNGIDLRYCSDGNNLIIQCKRYKEFSTLYSALKKEHEKVQLLAPTRYIVVTSVDLTPHRKERIFNLFQPYILEKEDIFGRDDLNNLISKYPDIEKKNYKLWLSSINILQEIINRNIVNQSRFVLDDIRDNLKVYVENDSYFEAVRILEEEKHVIISGIPGIGKTTLAEIIVYNLLANGVEEFIFLSDSIKEGYDMFDNEKSQVFLFDDFLGSNFLMNSLRTNEDSSIIRFISKIKRSRNKYLIFTTREYILNQAKIKYELFDNADFAKCIIDLSKYTKLAKAKILYNHLFFYEVPIEYVNQLNQQKYIFKILEHRNYNPRIIEAVTKNKIWDNISPVQFPSYIYNAFENPELIWKHTFENGIQQKSRIILYVLLILGGSCEYDILFEEVTSFTKGTGNNYSANYTRLSFKNCIKELENTFIGINTNASLGSNITYQNPSIQDFIVNYIQQEEELKLDLIANATYLNLLLGVFSDKSGFDQVNNKLSLSDGAKFEDMIIARFDDFLYLDKLGRSQKSEEDIIVLKLHVILIYFDLSIKTNLQAFVIKKLNEILYSSNIKDSIYYFIQLLNELEIDIDVKRIMYHVFNEGLDYEDIIEISKLQDIDKKAYWEFVEEEYESYVEKISEIVWDLMQDMDDDYLNDTLDNIAEIESISEIDFSDEKVILRQKIEQLEGPEYGDFEAWDRDRGYSNIDFNTEDRIIEDLFKSYQ